MKPIIRKESGATYHDNHDFVSVSTLKRYKRSPFHKLMYEPEETAAKIFGQQYHKFILEPEDFKRDYLILDPRAKIRELLSEYKKPTLSNKYKDWLQEQIGDREENEYIHIDNYLKMLRMRKQLYAHPFTWWLLNRGRNEMSIYLELDGVKVKIRPDAFFVFHRICVDLKTCQDASFETFRRDIAKYNYHIQAGLFTNVLDIVYPHPGLFKYYWIAQESQPPYCAAVYKASYPLLSVGLYEYEILLQQHKYCLDTGIYEGYEVFADNKYGIREIDLPGWSIRKLEYFNRKAEAVDNNLTIIKKVS